MPSMGYASVALAIALSPANIAVAKRVDVPLGKQLASQFDAETGVALFEDEEDVEVGEASAPRFAASSVLEFEVNKCTLMHMEAFQRGLSGCAAAVSPAEAVEIALGTSVVQDLIEEVDGPLVVAAEDEADITSALSLQGVSEDSATLAMCVKGSDFAECVKHLHPPMWVSQRYYIMNLLEDLTGPEHESKRAAFEAKLQLYRQATQAYGFAFTRTQNICTEELSEPMEDQVRACILGDALPDFLSNPNSQFSSRQNIVHYFHTSSLAAEEGYDMSNSTSKAAALSNWLLQYWRYRDEQYAYTRFAMRGFQRQCSDAVDNAREQKRMYKHAIQGTLFSIHRRADPYCRESVQSPTEAQGFLERMSSEVTAVCDPDSCSERPGAVAPEGFACDLRRASRQGSDLALGSTLGAVAGLALVLSVPVLGVGVVGLVTAEGVSSAALIAAGLAFPGKGPAVAVGATVGAQELRASCMAYPLICQYSPELDRCEVVPSEQQAASSPSNPFSSGPGALPFTGFKCVQDGEAVVGLTKDFELSSKGIRQAVSQQTQCTQKQCRPVDAIVEGPKDPTTGFQLFGRVGLGEDGGVYNCLNTNSSTHSSLPYLAVLPDPSNPAASIENTAENRALLLRTYLDGQ